MQARNVYTMAREVVREIAALLSQLKRHDRALADQLKRAAQSVLLNIAEARGSDAGNARARFATACGSAKEVRAALHIAGDWGYIGSRRATHLDDRLDEVCAITWCLARGRWRHGSTRTIGRRVMRACGGRLGLHGRAGSLAASARASLAS